MIVRRRKLAITLALFFCFTFVLSISNEFLNPTANEIPKYVVDYAPLVHLFSGEQFWPCDIAEHLNHTTPYLNYTPLQARTDHPTLNNLDDLNRWGGGRHVFLQSNDDVEERPEWLVGKKNIPVTDPPTGSLAQDLLKDGPQPQPKKGYSDAPAVLVVIPKENGIVDAFWFYFYSYNLGNTVFNVRFGNHIGDWEHSVVRFQQGKPIAVFCSEHSGGRAYTYEAVEKRGDRPVIYSATGTHAMYATPGVHPYVLPFGVLHDETDRGPLWDPILNSHTYTFNLSTNELLASNITPEAPTRWFYYAGHWGDKFYPLTDSRQYTFAGQFHYVNGPLGPIFKNLGRRTVCQSWGVCDLRDNLDEESVPTWIEIGEGDDWDDYNAIRPPTPQFEEHEGL